MSVSAGYLKFAGNRKVQAVSYGVQVVYYPDDTLYHPYIGGSSPDIGVAGIIAYYDTTTWNMDTGARGGILAFIKTGAAAGYGVAIDTQDVGSPPASGSIDFSGGLIQLKYMWVYSEGDDGSLTAYHERLFPLFKPDFASIPAPQGTWDSVVAPVGSFDMDSYCGAQYGKDWSSGTAPDWQTVFTPDDKEAGTIHAMVQEGSTYQYQVWGYLRRGTSVDFQKGTGEAGFIDIGNATNKVKVQNSSGAIQVGLTANATLKVRIRIQRYKALFT